MIHYVLILNRQGKTRLAKWYNNIHTEAHKQETVNEVHRLVSTRDLKHQSNFVELRENKLVYRRYAGLYFIVLIDFIDNELSYLEYIHFFVEILDTYFDNVCELDLVFNFYKLYTVIDEVFLGGELLETLKTRVLQRLEHIDEISA
ncbi:Adaptor protein complex sigma subunit [Metschnikowia bicuspidata var. bicuspidata NRRL YB-4993]|uniref:AP complex subunit sigma n=1 Tax=Metschnikowia bicuspidata var. bicuspidata NRRL YB-4993 TaxID=869754 RepID=A0A1A0HAD1_9ASCO|nr:Adaptor protein complex sigma subunit [Metschnikowia bicuspidata var. bicuspidata NRRL YB-4993]OBA20971.1 Adaptor protein complex sigma subunit [Metschnikowia bicuspidata var. bicuspidata NRRL YB-4993]